MNNIVRVQQQWAVLCKGTDVSCNVQRKPTLVKTLGKQMIRQQLCWPSTCKLLADCFCLFQRCYMFQQQLLPALQLQPLLLNVPEGNISMVSNGCQEHIQPNAFSTAWSLSCFSCKHLLVCCIHLASIANNCKVLMVCTCCGCVTYG